MDQEVEHNGQKFLILLAGAYSAGIIAPEMNGIAIIHNKGVLTDQWLCTTRYTWHEPAPDQVALFNQLTAADWPTFVEMVNDAPRLRRRLYLDLEPPKPKRAPTKLQKIKAFAKAFELPQGYNAANKEAWHTAGKAFMAMFAKDLGGKASYNAAGIACSGDWSVRTDTLHLCINADKHCGSGGYFRREVNRTVGPNHHWRPPTTVAEYDMLVGNLKRCSAPLFERVT
jgi:hypothetical protein